MGKNCLQLVLPPSTHIVYHIMTTVLGYVSYCGKMYRCRPSNQTAISFYLTNYFDKMFSFQWLLFGGKYGANSIYDQFMVKTMFSHICTNMLKCKSNICNIFTYHSYMDSHLYFRFCSPEVFWKTFAFAYLANTVWLVFWKMLMLAHLAIWSVFWETFTFAQLANMISVWETFIDLLCW